MKINREDLRQVTTKYLADTGMSKSDLSIKIGLSRALLSRYLSDKYDSDPSNIENALIDYFERLDIEAKEQTEDVDAEPKAEIKSRKVSEFFPSTDAMNILAMCDLCQKYIELGIITGRSGYGKTHTLKHYAKKDKVCYIECDDSMTCRDMVEAIEMAIGIPRCSGTVWSRVRGIKEYFNINEGYLLIVDEADKLMTKYSTKKMEILRTIYDQCDVGIVIAGEPNLENMLKAYLPRFASRANFIKLEGLSAEEIENYLADIVIDEDALSELVYRGTNSSSGSFRVLNRTIKNLMRMTAADKAISSRDIKVASNMMML